MSLWEHAAVSGRFAEYASGPVVSLWSLVGSALVSGLTILSTAADVAQVVGVSEEKGVAAAMPAQDHDGVIGVSEQADVDASEAIAVR